MQVKDLLMRIHVRESEVFNEVSVAKAEAAHLSRL